LELDLPEGGTLLADCGNTLVCAPHDPAPICILEGLDFDDRSGPFEGETGCVQWCAERGRTLMNGHWRVQCIDNEQAEPEHGLFAAGGEA
jgi:hypothetical protein